MWQDYYSSTDCAEAVNALTNLAFVYMAYRGITSCLQSRADKIYLVGFGSHLIIGLASFIFHATLKCKSCGPSMSVLRPFHGW